MTLRLFWMAALASRAMAGDFVEDLQQLREKGDHSAVQKFLAEAQDKQRENPDYYASGANYWWSLASEPNLSTKPSAQGEPSIRDPKSGEEVGSISTNGEVNPELRAKALALTTEGFRKFPHRLDLGFGLAHVQMEMGRSDAAAATLLQILEVCRKSPKSLVWQQNKPLPQPAERFVPEAIQGHVAALFNQRQPASDALAAKICEATIATYPDHGHAYNMLAVLAGAKDDKAGVVRYLKLAHEKAPKDTLILMNLADQYRRQGMNAEAIAAYRKVVSADPDGELAADAQAALKELEK